MAPAAPSRPAPRVAARWLAALALAVGAPSLPVAPPRVAEADSLATERYRDKTWKFSFLTFKEWEQVPLETKGTTRLNVFDDCMVARFAERQSGRTPGILRVFRMVNGGAAGRPVITTDGATKPTDPAPTPPNGPGKPPTPPPPPSPLPPSPLPPSPLPPSPLPPSPTPPAPGTPPTPPAPEAPTPSPDPTPSRRRPPGPKDMTELLSTYLSMSIGTESNVLGKGAKEVKSKDGVPGRLWAIETAGAFFVIAIYEKDGTEVGLLFGGDVAARKKLEAPFTTGAKSLRWFDEKAEDVEGLPQLEGLKLTARKRREIETGLVEGWDVLVSPKKNYVVVYDTKGRTNTPLARMIAERIEQIRAQVYEVQFPPAGPIEAVSIVRLCGGAAEYRHYGGPPGSAGYWNDDSEELVFYDASPKREADDNTLAVLYHEAFHQYIYYSVGKVAPHSWFNEGHGDYYAGAKYTDKKFVIRPFAWRVPVVKAALQAGPCDYDVVAKDGRMIRRWDRSNRGYSPLSQLVEMDQAEYYSYPSVSYAQGWSLVYFLREIVPKNPAWNAKWGKILTTYFDTLKAEVKRIDEEEAAAKAKRDRSGSGMGGGNPTPPPGTTPTPPAPPAPGPAAPTPPAPRFDPTPPAPAPTPPPTPPAPTPPAPVPPTPVPPTPVPPTPPAGPPPEPPEPAEPDPEVGIALTGPRYSSSDRALRKALRAAFDGVDLEELEQAWRESISKVNLKR